LIKKSLIQAPLPKKHLKFHIIIYNRILLIIINQTKAININKSISSVNFSLIHKILSNRLPNLITNYIAIFQQTRESNGYKIPSSNTSNKIES
jgi:hypothetical protein